MLSKWKELSTGYRILLIVKIVLSIVIIVWAILSLFEIWDDSEYLYVPSMGMLMLIQTIEEWNKHRAIAVFSLCASLFIFACFIAELFII